MRDTFLLLVVDLGFFFGGVCVGGVGSMFLDYCFVTCVWNCRDEEAMREEVFSFFLLLLPFVLCCCVMMRYLTLYLDLFLISVICTLLYQHLL